MNGLTQQQRLELKIQIGEYTNEFKKVSVNALQSKGKTRKVFLQRRAELNQSITAMTDSLYGSIFKFK